MTSSSEKQRKLDQIAKRIEACEECKKDAIGKAVPGEGNPDADIMFVGEAPGKQEAQTGRPFIGRSGKLLRSLIKQVGLEEKDVFITSPVKYLPKRGTPTRATIQHARALFFEQVEIIDPTIMVLLGKTAAYAVLNEDIPILACHGEIRKYKGRKLLVTLHPAAALRFPKYKNLLLEDFKKLRELIKK